MLFLEMLIVIAATDGATVSEQQPCTSGTSLTQDVSTRASGTSLANAEIDISVHSPSAADAHARCSGSPTVRNVVLCF